MKSLITAFLIIVSASAFGGQCDKLYYTGKQINVPFSIELCNSFYVVAWSKSHKGPLVSFERFDADGPDTPRHDSFRVDPRVSGANLGDYLNSLYDRGHLTPAADATNSTEMRDTFLLTNIVPQAPKLNRVKWKQLEEKVRQKKGITYIATGVIYGNRTLGKNKIGIPERMYKIVWYSNNTSAAYIAFNKDSSSIEETNISRISGLTNINFPTK